MTDLDYRQYSLDQLSNWIHDAMSADEATPQEIYNTIQKAVKENYDHHKKQADRAYELMNKLNIHPYKDSQYYNPIVSSADVFQSQYVDGWNLNTLGVSTIGDFTINNSIIDFSGLTYTTKEELNTSAPGTITFKSCSSDDTSPECMTSWNDFWMDDKITSIHNTEDGDLFTHDEDKVVKWRLPVQVDGLTGECYINLPDDLLELAGLKEGDAVNWVDNGDGSFTLEKVEKSEETEL